MGESGSGKSLTALSIARLVEEPATRRRPAPHLLRDRPARGTGGRSDPRQAAGHLARRRLPGPDDLVQPHDADRRPAGRGRPSPPGTRSQGGVRPRRRPSAGRPRPRPGAPGPPVPLRVLGRHASARHDRDGPDGQPAPHHRRRADDRARRHGAEPGAGAAPGRPPRGGGRSPAHQPRRLGRRRRLRPRARHVCRPDRRGPPDGRPAHPGTSPVHPRARRRGAGHDHRRRRPAGHHPRPPGRAGPGPDRLRVRRALPARHRPLPRAGPDPDGRPEREPRGVLARDGAGRPS